MQHSMSDCVAGLGYLHVTVITERSYLGCTRFLDVSSVLCAFYRVIHLFITTCVSLINIVKEEEGLRSGRDYNKQCHYEHALFSA
jgi:hypothetical protein